jgi:hypothetical protein
MYAVEQALGTRRIGFCSCLVEACGWSSNGKRYFRSPNAQNAT